MTTESNLYAQQVTTVLSYALSVYGSFHYFLFHHHTAEYQTPFTGLWIITAIFWAFLLFTQLLFVLQFFVSNESVTSREQKNVSAIVGYHFTLFNILNFFWTYFFSRHSFVISFIILVANFFNLLSLYTLHKTYSVKTLGRFVVVHVSTAALPLSWVLYAIFWNGAALFHSHNHGLAARILANVLIWDFLLVPFMYLAFYGDWAIGFSSAFLTLGIGLGQFFTKAIALQWIFAFIIAGLVFIASALVAVGSTLTPNARQSSSEQAPLLA
ncbi:unnamed protein product [Kuraishia capsulata CBS 1993]|uniref:DUF1774-domain-containing protein n=1 Tax=Kuraishia capsulata CBS 1993 TaxID=1382522 RepID=W6MKP4_9ASCO|nr:uncharacterized protein KUCA_T00001286001 [Kuraishia capsulata CBS 1993]CDK25317.1 unnamed protein product [Kuraishia capsulata CBS 1993]